MKHPLALSTYSYSPLLGPQQHCQQQCTQARARQKGLVQVMAMKLEGAVEYNAVLSIMAGYLVGEVP